MNANELTFDVEARFMGDLFDEPCKPAETCGEEAFDLKELGVIKAGTFDSAGQPVGWITNVTKLPPIYPNFMDIQPVLLVDAMLGFVFIRGIYSKKFTSMLREATGII